MSGHSKWSSIKHKKAKEDARRGKVFTKLIRELTVAARAGGADPDSNPRLRQSILAAKASNMPNDNIERAIKKGTGELEGMQFEETSLEGYGPAGVAVLVEVMTDNRNRTVAEIRHLFDRYNGKLGEAGCVSWMFENHGLIAVDKATAGEDALMEIALDAGADDVRDGGESWEVLTSVAAFEDIKNVLEEKGIAYSLAELTKVPQTTVKLVGKDAERMFKLMDVLEDSDDVQNVYANFDVDDEEMEKLSA